MIPSTSIRARRWVLWVHLSCGLALALYAVVLGLTGSVLVFREELVGLMYPEFHSSTSVRQDIHMSPDAALDATKAALPGWTPVSVTWPNAGSPHWMVYLIRGPEATEAYVNAETGRMVGTHDPSGDWVGWMLRMHVNFHAGSTGRLVNGYGAVGLLGLCLTGVVLWWPPRLQFASRFRIDLRSGWKRLSWQLHHATGIVALAFIAILAFTGSYYVWLQSYIKVVDRYFERSVDPKVPAHEKGSALLSLAELARVTEKQFPGRPLYRASIPSAEYPVRITVLEGRPQQFHLVSSVAMDAVTGEVLQVARLDQRPTGNSILSWFSVLHFGRFGGDGIGFWLVKLLWGVLALSLPLLAVTGCLMWWKRVIGPLLLLFVFFLQGAWAQQDVVSLSSPLTETVYLLGQENRLAAVSDSSVFPEKAVADRAAGQFKVLNFGVPDFSVIDAIHPSLILTSTSFQREMADKLRAKGYRVLHFEPETIEDVFTQTEAIGEALGKGSEAVAITRGLRDEVASIAAKSAGLPKIRVYMEINHMGPWTSGGKSPENEMIRVAGGENVFADLASGATVVANAEVIRRNPDIILSPIWLDAKVGGIDGITPLLEIMSRPGYNEIAAVRNSRVLYYDSALLKQQGPREVLAIRKLAYLLHPEAFENPAGTIPWELGRVRQ